ncbi:hypothetical protein [Trichocoleus sp. FACHB-591]|uniref:phosphatase domain-containing putative toxin n=1 Tax=Trichocoleus sp. FACHB-591 TaxID=2692872 RepID=UPI001F553ABF|nr:hypothetical protein [Trichocoleus sp. FACHB-591]
MLGCYKQAFGIKNVCWAAIAEFEICDCPTLQRIILPFLLTSNQCQQKPVVHCSGGIGRTGQVLSAWLVFGRGLSRQAGVQAVRQTGKNPYEAVIAAPIRGKSPFRVLARFEQSFKRLQS